ncbi:MAG: hypothetical protein V1934_00695 [Methanobacteriota archaeon]
MPSSDWWKPGADGMLPPWLEIFAADALSAWRNTGRRARKNAFYTFWFVVLAIFAFSAVAWIIAFISRSDDLVAFPLAVNDILFLFFMAFVGKALVDFYHLLVERQATVFLLSQPMRLRNIVAGKLLTVSAFNLALLALGLGIMTAMTFVNIWLYFVIPPFIVADLIILTLLASSVGFAYSILSGLSSWGRKFAGAALYSPIATLVWLFTMGMQLDGWALTQAYLATYLLSLAVLPIPASFLVESWNTLTTSKATSHASRRRMRGSMLSGPIRRLAGANALAVFEKEVRNLLRRREGVGNAITLLGFVAFAFYFFNQLDTMFQMEGIILRVIPALVVGLSLFLAVVILCVIPALGIISKDGKGAWALKVAPVPEEDIVNGKALSILLMAPFIVVAVALPLPILLGSPPMAWLYASLGAICMCAASTGVSIWIGAKYPNFDEASGNAPDVMTMYVGMLACMMLCALLLLPPVALAFSDQILGLLLLILSVDIGFLVLHLGVKGAARSFAKLELSN